nr:MAG TPA: hypothetical protein [Caudoviricetes sp.]
MRYFVPVTYVGEVLLPYFVAAKIQKLSELCKRFLNHLAVKF